MLLQIKAFIIGAKNTIIIISILCFAGLLYYTSVITNQLKNVKADNERVTNNFQNSQFKLDSVKNKNGELQFSVNTLTLKANEFAQFVPELKKEIEDMGLKIKNLESVVKLNVKYVYDIDTIEVEKKSENVFIGRYNDKFLKLSEKVTLIKNKTDIKIDSLKMTIVDNILMPHEIQYKPVWIFWKKPVGIKVWIKSTNPHFNVDRFETYDLTK